MYQTSTRKLDPQMVGYFLFSQHQHPADNNIYTGKVAPYHRYFLFLIVVDVLCGLLSGRAGENKSIMKSSLKGLFGTISLLYHGFIELSHMILDLEK